MGWGSWAPKPAQATLLRCPSPAARRRSELWSGGGAIVRAGRRRESDVVGAARARASGSAFCVWPVKNAPGFSQRSAMPASASHRRTGSNENLLTPHGEATVPNEMQAIGEEETEILQILAQQNDPPGILPSPKEPAAAPSSSIQPPSVTNIHEVAIDVVASATNHRELPVGSPRSSSSSFDRRFPMLLCVSCLCCMLIAFVLVAVWGGAQGGAF